MILTGLNRNWLDYDDLYEAILTSVWLSDLFFLDPVIDEAVTKVQNQTNKEPIIISISEHSQLVCGGQRGDYFLKQKVKKLRC